MGSRVAALAVAVLAVLAGCAGDDWAAQLARSPVTVVTTTTIPVDAEVEDLMAGAGMTEAGRALFVRARPRLEDRATLARSCADLDGGEAGTHTYGCVVGGMIHVRVFSAPELHDLRYVVAAHELLHLAYPRLGAAERSALDAELAAVRARNPALERRLAVYAETAEDTPDEVHAVLGTEFEGLSAALEAHYARYFDRARVLAAFRRTLGDREAEIFRLEAAVEEIEGRLAALDAELRARERAGDPQGYNARVPTFNALVAEHNALVGQLNARVDEHRRLTSS